MRAQFQKLEGIHTLSTDDPHLEVAQEASSPQLAHVGGARRASKDTWRGFRDGLAKGSTVETRSA